MPVLFIGHGSPMNAIKDNPWTPKFKEIAAGLPKPKAILSISAHWYVPGTFLTGDERPPTIHDFGGFPKALFEIEYRAPGSGDLAKDVAKLLALPADRGIRTGWGLDHGTWSVLMHMYPKADIPVVQLSIDQRLTAKQHFELARSLGSLRDQGVLILGSGNLTHNLRHAMGAWQRGDTETPQWAAEFDLRAKLALDQHDANSLITALDDEVGRLSHPSPDHYLPLLYAVAATTRDDRVSHPISGWDGGSLSMRSVRFG